ncbi:ATP-binding protein [Vreelandella salicampi]|uniref:histidine kinase n=1 Tax=Vreelandella salicampi TaxID=1449798 RepID=A0A7Z0LJL7_9GAMM|nr:ATP-binding protein [Halomonas salicampi]NYS60191.1 GAF domain-containing protein [Halomonas salicampi]
MQVPDTPDNEAQRLQALRDLHVLDTPAEQAFDRLAEFARELFDVPIALVSLVDEDRQWFKTHLGVDAQETPRDLSFCAHAVADNAPLVIHDALKDARVADHPQVESSPHIRFYAGIPLRPTDGLPVGTLCLLDYQPREFSARDLCLLESLAGQAEELLRQQKISADLARTAKRYEALFSSSAVAKVRIDRAGTIIAVNTATVDFLGYTKEQLIGQNVAILTPPEIARDHDAYINRYLAGGSPKVVGKGREVEAQHKDGHRIPVHLAINAIHDDHGKVDEFLGVLTDLTDIYATHKRMHKEQSLLKVLHQGITDYQALMSGERLWTFLMEALRTLTDSDYSLIGEVLPTDANSILKIHAITDLSWNEESRGLMERLRRGDMMLTNPNTLLGRVFAHGEVIMTDDLYHHRLRGGFPPGHPPINNYLGVPIFSSGKLIGMFAIANSQQMLNQELLDWLQPFTDTCALLINLYRQMAEREHVMSELAQARDQAEKANRAKSDFLSSMSHELRTPLNSILGFAQILASGKRHPLNDKQLRQVNQIEKSGQHLLSLINEVLDLAKIEAGRLPLSIEPIHVQRVVQDACDALEANADAAGITLVRCNMPEEWRVSADYTRTKQVLLNLISNAIKYNRANGRVEISAQAQGNMLRLSITDTGPGVDLERQHELFEPFNRLDAENGTIEGTGIGLAITRELVERMGGEIDVESSPNQGATFWFTLPTTSDMSAAPKHPHIEHEPYRTPPKQHTLLYIEDNPANQRLMEDIIDDVDDVALHTAPSAEIGLEIMRSRLPDMVLMDIHLPGMDGYQALEVIRNDLQLKHLPIIALSANAMPNEIKSGLATGFDDYLTKPLEIDKLLNTLQRHTQPRGSA